MGFASNWVGSTSDQQNMLMETTVNQITCSQLCRLQQQYMYTLVILFCQNVTVATSKREYGAVTLYFSSICTQFLNQYYTNNFQGQSKYTFVDGFQNRPQATDSRKQAFMQGMLVLRSVMTVGKLQWCTGALR